MRSDDRLGLEEACLDDLFEFVRNLHFIGGALVGFFLGLWASDMAKRDGIR